MKHVKFPALVLALTLLFTLAACKPAAADPTAPPTQAPSSEPAPSAEPTQEPSVEPTESSGLADDETPDVRLAVLSGPTGVGAAKLLDNVNNHGTANHMGYAYTIASDKIGRASCRERVSREV